MGDKLHDALGSGYYAEPALLILLALGIFLDYRDMNRIGDRLPRLPGERVIHPFGELRHLFWAFLADPRLLAHSLLFVQDRKQLAFSLLGTKRSSTKDISGNGKKHCQGGWTGTGSRCWRSSEPSPSWDWS